MKPSVNLTFPFCLSQGLLDLWGTTSVTIQCFHCPSNINSNSERIHEMLFLSYLVKAFHLSYSSTSLIVVMICLPRKPRCNWLTVTYWFCFKVFISKESVDPNNAQNFMLLSFLCTTMLFSFAWIKRNYFILTNTFLKYFLFSSRYKSFISWRATFRSVSFWLTLGSTYTRWFEPSTSKKKYWLLSTLLQTCPMRGTSWTRKFIVC